MRFCRTCQRINGDTDTACRGCGTELASQLVLPPATAVPRALPDHLARRNRNAALLLGIIALGTLLNLFFWRVDLPALQRTQAQERRALLQQRQTRILDALTTCLRETGGIPAHRLSVLQQFAVTRADLTPGADPTRWSGPYLPLSAPFPENPYRPGDGADGWRAAVKHGKVVVWPAHESAP